MTIGPPSIPPEQPLRALLLQYFYAVRSERLLMEEIETLATDGSNEPLDEGI